MKRQLFVVAFCGVLLFMVGLLWWRVRELERTVNSLRIQPVTNSTVLWQKEQQPKSDAPKKQVFKLIDSPEPVHPDKSEVGVPWNVERAMMGDGQRNATPMRQGEMHWEAQPDPNSSPLVIQPDSK
jgi:hypothetical protein